MDEFQILNVNGGGGLLFYDRSPHERSEPFNDYWVRISDHNLLAAANIYAGYAHSHPTELFADMARRWSGWSGELVWNSSEEDLVLRCSHDGWGHISIRVELRSLYMTYDWRLMATIRTEAGQLQDIARRAALFFGQAA